MADKIVQLTDKNDNNLYPIAGALFTDAVDTASIQNQAVTSDKIDWTTLPSAASRLAFAGIGTIPYRLPDGSDLDTAEPLQQKSGFFVVANAQNGPIPRGSTTWFYIINMVYRDDIEGWGYSLQIATSFGDSADTYGQAIYYRKKFANTWQAWRKLAVS